MGWPRALMPGSSGLPMMWTLLLSHLTVQGTEAQRKPATCPR